MVRDAYPTNSVHRQAIRFFRHCHLGRFKTNIVLDLHSSHEFVLSIECTSSYPVNAQNNVRAVSKDLLSGSCTLYRGRLQDGTESFNELKTTCRR
jgi:hypothetical protein